MHTRYFNFFRKPTTIRVTHGGELDCNTCDRTINTQDSSEGGRHPAGRARVDDDDDDGGDNEDDDDDHEDAANDGDGDYDDKNDVNDER